MSVTVDAVYATVYEGIVEALGDRRNDDDEFAHSPVVQRLKDILQLVVPLNLTEPRSPQFAPPNCRTLHDITRFAHEMAVRAMFHLSKESHFAEHSARQLVADVPLKWWVIDLEDGIMPGVKGKTVKTQHIASIPWKLLWEGMTALPWKGPPPIDTKGFMSAMVKASSDPNIEPAVGSRFVDRNYILVAKNFCNVSTRLGFHFSTIEAYLGDQADQNYISFLFTGGGGDDGRKNRRVRLISRLLERFDFRVEIKADTIFARLEGHPPPTFRERLKVLGHVVIHTRQMDMVMYNDKMVDWYYKEIVGDILSFIAPDGGP